MSASSGSTTVRLALWACMVVAASGASAQSPAVFIHDYPFDTPDLVEDHFLVLDTSGVEPRGWYYGTSDEFDVAREGYLPGYFVAPMMELTLSGASISFTLQRPGRLFTSPVPLEYRSAGDVPAGLLEEWTVPLPVDAKAYVGQRAGDEVALDVEGGPRRFRRTEP